MSDMPVTPLPYATARPIMAEGSPGTVPPRAIPFLPGAREAECAVKSPRCLIGLPSAKRTEHLVASLHSDAARRYFRRNGARLKDDLLSGERRIVLTHHACTADEISVAVELLKIADTDYPCALMAAFALAGHLDAPLTVEDVHLIVEEGDFSIDPAAPDENELTLSVIMARRAHFGTPSTFLIG